MPAPPPPALVRLLDHDAEVRLVAVAHLDPRNLHARFALRQTLLSDEDASVRAAAAQKLGEIVDAASARTVIPALVEALADAMPAVRDRAFRALARLGAEALLPHAQKAARKEPVWWVRRSAIRAAASVAVSDAVPLLLEALSDPFWRVRHAAVQALGWIGEEDFSVRQDVLAARDAQGGTVASAIIFLAGLWRGDDVEASPVAPEFAREQPWETVDDDPAVVTDRLEKLKKDEIPARALVAWLGDPHAPLRALARARIRERDSQDDLFLALRWLDEPRIPHAAAEVRALLDRLAPDDLFLARRVLQTSAVGPGALAWAAEIVALRNDKESIERVRALAKNPDPALRCAALKGLLRDPRSLSYVLEALRDPDEDVRAVALSGWEKRPPTEDFLITWANAIRSASLNLKNARERRALAEATLLVGTAKDREELSEDVDPSLAALALAARAAQGELDRASRERALAHEDPWIRAAVLDPAEALHLAPQDPDPWIRRASIDLVARRKTDLLETDVRETALACAADPDPWIRARAADLLDPDAHPEELRALLRLSQNENPMARAAAASRLERADDLSYLLRQLLDEPSALLDDELRTSALTWLLRTGDPEAIDQLARLLEQPGETEKVKKHLAALTLSFPDESFAAHPDALRHRPSPPAPLAAPPPPKRIAHRPDVILRPLGTTGLLLSPLVLSGANGLVAPSFAEARDQGINSFFWEPRYQELTRYLRSRRADRENLVLITGTYHAGPEALRADVDRALRRLRTDYLDVFLLFWVRSPTRLSTPDFETLQKLKEEGKIRTFGFSTHDRKTALAALETHPWPVVMTRHSAAHPGAEEKLLPKALTHGTGILTFTATSYGRLLKPAPGPPPVPPVPTAPDCYRYSLSQPGVSATLTAPRNHRELLENLTLLPTPTLKTPDLANLRAHGLRVRAETRRFDTLIRRAPGGVRDTLRTLLAEDTQEPPNPLPTHRKI